MRKGGLAFFFLGGELCLEIFLERVARGKLKRGFLERERRIKRE